MAEDLDTLEEFEAKKTAHTIPVGWLILYIGLIIFGIYYVVAYTPGISGWSQEKAYQESLIKK